MAFLNRRKEDSAEQFSNMIIQQAVLEHASDIHIEPMVDAMRIRFRIDGMLQDRGTRPVDELEPILNRLKAISNLDLTSRAPQDGHFEFMVDQPTRQRTKNIATAIPDPLFAKYFMDARSPRAEENVTGTVPAPSKETIQAHKEVLDIRVSFFLTIYGESVVMRLLNREDTLIPLKDLGMGEERFQIMQYLVSRTYGMVLVTGPSGVGKTTTLYAMLREIKSGEKNIMTLEDPVEFYFGDIRQCQVSAHQGLTFATGMRSILRQDPDVIMIGEIRDPETAEQAVRASLVGRLVCSTIHSNTTVGTIARLMDMNVEHSLIAYAINGVVSQRLVRKICASCRVEYTPDPVSLKNLGLHEAAVQFVKGGGCKECDGTGYRGRTGIFEVLQFDDGMRSLIVERKSMNEISNYAMQNGLKTLKQHGVEKVFAGVTTVEEVAHSV
jgi:type IV pilus assembly protein PilB